jgi:hypothetical protein
MPEHARTKDEFFLVCLYQEARKLPDLEDPLDRYAIGTLAGLHKTAVDTICVLLMKTNFIKKHGQVEISITPHGMKLAEQLLKNK